MKKYISNKQNSNKIYKIIKQERNIDQNKNKGKNKKLIDEK